MLLNFFDHDPVVVRDSVQAFRVLDAVDDLARRTDDAQLRRYTGLTRATYAWHHTPSHAQNAALYLAVGQRAERADEPDIAAVCRHVAGQYFFLGEDYGRAFEHLLAANQAFRKLGYGRIPRISQYLYELAYAQFYFREYEKTAALLTEAARYPPPNPTHVIQVYNTLGMAHTWLYSFRRSSPRRSPLPKNRDHSDPNASGQHDRRAEWAYRKARQAAITQRDTVWIGITTSNLANLYWNREDRPAAFREFRVSYALGRRHGVGRTLPSDAALSLAELFLHQRQLDSCRYYLDQSEAFHRHNVRLESENRFEWDYFHKKHADVARRYYRAVGQFDRAYAFADSLLRVEKRLNQRAQTEQLSLVERKLLVQRHQLDVAGLQREQADQRRLFGVVTGALVLVAGLFFRLYSLSRVRRRQEAALGSERERSLRLEKQLVEEELGRARADLLDFVERMRQKNVRFGESPAPNPQSLAVASLLTDDDWVEFRQRFERVHPGFFGQLHDRFAHLSPAEERLLALVKLGVDTRQMSRMLGISPESIRKTRYRLRRKLGLDGQASLRELLGTGPGVETTGAADSDDA